MLLCYFDTGLLCCGEANLSSAKGFKHRQAAATPFPANRKISRLCFTMQSTKRKYFILNTGRSSLSQKIVHETRAKAKRIKIVFHDTNASQLWITKHECITILNNKAKLCPNLETHFPKPCAQQSQAWLLWFQTPVTPHSFSRVSNYFCERPTLVRRSVELLQKQI